MAGIWDELDEIRKKVVVVRDSSTDGESRKILAEIAASLSGLTSKHCPVKTQPPIDIVSDKSQMAEANFRRQF